MDAVTRAYTQTDYGIYVTIGGAAFGDIALVPAPWLKHPKGIRDVEEWYISTFTRQAYVKAVFECQCEVALRNIEHLAKAVGDRVQVAFVSGTDFGTQTGTFCSVATYRELYKPYHAAVNGQIHELTRWKTFIHSCGAVLPLIPEFIDAGFDVLNPVQCSATGMDPRRLKREFGRDLVFWGGGVDTQKTLPFGTPEEVYREVRERIDIFCEGGRASCSTRSTTSSPTCRPRTSSPCSGRSMTHAGGQANAILTVVRLMICEGALTCRTPPTTARGTTWAFIWLICLVAAHGRPAVRLRLGRHRRGQAVLRAVLPADQTPRRRAGPTVAR